MSPVCVCVDNMHHADRVRLIFAGKVSMYVTYIHTCIHTYNEDSFLLAK
jgi:hypothetical protein